MFLFTFIVKFVTGALCFLRRYIKLGLDLFWGSDVKSKFCDFVWMISMVFGWFGMKVNCYYGCLVGVVTSFLVV